MVKKEKLFDQFPPVTTEAWMEKISTDLKGADFSKKLVWKTNEGFDVNPFYRAEDIENLPYINSLPGRFPFIRGKKTLNNEWFIRQDILVQKYSDANRKALSILNRGVDSLGFLISDPETIDVVSFRMLLERIHLHAIELNIRSEGKAQEILDILRIIADEKRAETHKIRGAIEADPIGRLMTNGKLCVPVEKGLDYLAALTQSAMEYPLFRTIHLKAAAFSNGGTDLVEELAFGLSIGNEYMTQLTSRGIGADLAASKIRFSFGTGSGYFPEIAKLRAARLLWSVILSGHKAEDTRMEIHSVTTRSNKTVYDPYVNMLRTQTEAMSAILGGADSLTVEPFDKVFRTPDDFSERIARNQQLLLREESYFDKVADPSAGSYYIENITSLMADSAWKLFLSIEEQGGFLEALKSGYIQKRVRESAAKRRKDLAVRKSVLLGTNQYPDNGESLSATVDQDLVLGKRPEERELTSEPLVQFRGSEDYDRIRIAVDNSGKRPSVFLLQIGNPVMRKARAQFSAGFFGCAGYRIVDNQGFKTAEEGISAARESGAEITVICSSDDEYITFAPEIFSALKGKSVIVIAGNPPSAEELKTKGLEIFIHLRSDVPEMLRNFNTLLGIKM
jgi:methylmalonyl-CoA mutase